ncbi:MAG TPA: M4 family metallopeptidase [Thermoanaerobaculia bacterium]|nr:M4 family metallopeptidase [Thermoanaerobaculia bacterium]
MSRRLSPVLVFSLLCLSATLPVAAQSVSAVRDALGRMEEAAGGRVEVTLSPETGLVTFLTVDARNPVPVVGAAATSPEAIALAFLRDYAGAFGFRNAGDIGDIATEVELSGPAWRDEIGQDHVRFRQVVRGIPVTAGEVSVHLQGSDVVAVNAETLPDLDSIDVRPTFFANQALDVAWKLVTSPRLGSREDAELSAPRLEILNRSLLEPGRFRTRLAWFIEARAFGLREYIWIDAKRGVTLLHFNQLTDARNRQVHDGNSTAALPGTLVRSEGQAPTGDPDADAAYTYSGDAYDYFFTQHGRDSYDGAGAAIISTVEHCPTPGECPFENAFWDGTQLVYGEGYAGADDVDAHELTHAVTERTANLLYYMQSGSLNESFSDMFGETVDLTNTGGTDTPAVRWELGEDIPGGALRDMMNPGAFFDPGRVGDPNYFCDYFDGGGVHFNSGVPNHLYALMADGGTYNGQTVTGMGLTKAGKIAYRALTVYLLSGSSFGDAANAFTRSCADLVAGPAGITADDCKEVADALAAVEMAQATACGTAGQYPALCPAGQGPTNVFFDNFESGIANTNWQVQSTVETAWFLDDTPFSTSGIWHMTGFNFDFVNDSRVFMANSIAIPGSARMQFEHFWDFEPGTFDGGVVEYSLNGGTNWTDALALFSAGSDYSGEVFTGYGNPLSGRTAYVDTSRGYTGTQLNLATLAGQNNVKFRFRIGTDDSIGWWGWDVDDVRVYTCQSCTYSLLPATTEIHFTDSGGTRSLDLSTQAECSWATSSGASWVTVTPGATGSGKVGYTVARNTTGGPRSTTLTIGGHTITINQGGTDYYTVTPCRIFDTRTTTPLTSGETRVFNVAGSCGIPSTATAVSVNITSVSPTGLGFITLFAGGLDLPETTSISFVAGKNRANNAILALAPDGSGTVEGFASVAGAGNVHLILDVNGYFE